MHKQTALLLLGLTCLTALLPAQPSAAASVTSTSLVIRDNEKVYRENIGVNIGSTLKTCYIVFTPANTTNQNVTLTTSNPAIATVTARKEGTTTYADITGITEGVTTLTATAADGGSTYSSLVTVRTPIEEAEGELTESMKLKQSASDTASSFATTCVAGQRGRIKGSVGNYYYFDCPAGVLEKNYHVAYVPKNKVTIYANSITLNKESVTLNKEKKRTLNCHHPPQCHHQSDRNLPEQQRKHRNGNSKRTGQSQRQRTSHHHRQRKQPVHGTGYHPHRHLSGNRHPARQKTPSKASQAHTGKRQK